MSKDWKQTMSEVGHRTKHEAIDTAVRQGLVCLFPKPNELFLDLDKTDPAYTDDTVLNCLKANGIEIVSTLITDSKSGNHHMYIRLDPKIRLLPSHRICLQACLKSDPVREVLSLIRVMHKSECPTVLFETSKMAEKVLTWRKQ